MKIRRFIVAVLILVSLVPQAFTFSPARAPQQPGSVQAHPPITLVTFTVVNNTGGLMNFIMDGKSRLGFTKIYQYGGYLGRNDYRIEQGNYVVTFWACGRQTAKLLRITGNRKIFLDCKTNLIIR